MRPCGEEAGSKSGIENKYSVDIFTSHKYRYKTNLPLKKKNPIAQTNLYVNHFYLLNDR